MNRRTFLRSTTLAPAGLALVDRISSMAAVEVAPWRTFEVTTHVEVLAPAGMTRVWVPVPLVTATAYQRPLGNEFDAGVGVATLLENRPRGFAMVAGRWQHGTKPRLTVVSRVKTRDVAVEFDRPSKSQSHDDDLARFLAPSKLIPSDGIVAATATKITSGAQTDLAKARAIYDWIVENTFRDPGVRGCGTGDVRFMLEAKNLGGKCADLNALYVALAHAVGLPARDAYGVRVAKSKLGYKSLGLGGDNATRAQHCRAEVFLRDVGWVPVDPADVRKVALEEPPGNRPLTDEIVRQARTRLFGSWEMNWIAYNFEHDVVLPGSDYGPIPFLMYPQAETANGRLDSIDPDTFRYTITAKELPAT